MYVHCDYTPQQITKWVFTIYNQTKIRGVSQTNDSFSTYQAFFPNQVYLLKTLPI